MTTNPYFNHFSNQSEQGLVEDLIIESIKMYGVDMWYMPRRASKYDEVYHEDDGIYYDKAYQIELYVKEVDSFGGQGDFLSKFGLQINDTTTLTVANRRYDEVIGRYENNSRPQEGDLIFFPFNKSIFKVVFVEEESSFYQLGKLFVYDLKIELLEYSNEKIETGLPFIDNVITPYVQTDIKTIDELDDFFGDMSDNKILEDEGGDVLDFSESNPFSNTSKF